MNRLYLCTKEITPEELRGMLDALGLRFQFMLLEHFDKVEPGVYAPQFIRPPWLNRARFFGADYELRCRRKGERLWTVLASERRMPGRTGDEEEVLYHREQCRKINLWGKLLVPSTHKSSRHSLLFKFRRWLRAYPSRDVTACNGAALSAYWDRLLSALGRSSMREKPRWYEERLMQPISYPLCKAPLRVRLLRSPPEAPGFVDLEVKEYLDEVENVVAHRFVRFLPHERAEKKTKEA